MENSDIELKLPKSTEVDVKTFSDVWQHTTTSYKFLWFLAILKIVKSKNEPDINFRDISRQMIYLAAPSVYDADFDLAFGSNTNRGKGQTKDFLKNIAETHKPGNEPFLDNNEAFKTARGSLEGDAPYRFFTPFFKSELKNLENEKRIKKVIELTDDTFKSGLTPYRFININDDNNKAIEIHPRWLDYWFSNMASVRAWTIAHWIIYLKKRNKKNYHDRIDKVIRSIR